MKATWSGPWFWLLCTALCPTMVVFGWTSCIFRISYLPFQRVANLTRGTGYKLFWIARQSFCSRDPWNWLTGSSKRQATNCLVHFYRRCVSNDRLWLASDLVFFLMADESHLIWSMVLATISGTMVVFGWKSCIFRISYLPFQRVDNLTHGTGYKLYWVARHSFCSRDPWNCLTASSKRQATDCLDHFQNRCVSNDRSGP